MKCQRILGISFVLMPVALFISSCGDSGGTAAPAQPVATPAGPISPDTVPDAIKGSWHRPTGHGGTQLIGVDLGDSKIIVTSKYHVSPNETKEEAESLSVVFAKQESADAWVIEADKINTGSVKERRRYRIRVLHDTAVGNNQTKGLLNKSIALDEWTGSLNAPATDPADDYKHIQRSASPFSVGSDAVGFRDVTNYGGRTSFFLTKDDIDKWGKLLIGDLQW